MKKRLYSVLCLCLLIGFCGGMALYVKANDKELIKDNINSIIRACQFIGIYPVCEYKKGGGKTTLTYSKPVFSKNNTRTVRNSSGHKVTDYLTYSMTHKEGVNSKCQKTYNDTFNMTCKLGEDGVYPNALGPESPVEVYFNGFTLISTLGEGDKTKNLEDPEKGGMSVYNVVDDVSQMNLNVSIRWNKKGSAVCTMKAAPLKDLLKTDPKFQVVVPTEDQKPKPKKDGEQWYTSSDGGPVIAITLGNLNTWTWNGLAYNGTTKDKTAKGVDTESYTAKGKTAHWSN